MWMSHDAAVATSVPSFETSHGLTNQRWSDEQATSYGAPSLEKVHVDVRHLGVRERGDDFVFQRELEITQALKLGCVVHESVHGPQGFAVGVTSLPPRLVKEFAILCEVVLVGRYAR